MRSTKILSLALLTTLFFSGCEPLPTSDVEVSDMDMPVDGESMDEEVGDETESEEMVVELDAEAEAGVSEYVDFDQAAYEQALAEGKTVFLDYYAAWCPTCVSNAPKIEAAFEALGDANVMGFRVDYDNATELKREYGVVSQSTLVVVPNGDKDAARTLAPQLVSTDDVLEFIQQ